MTGPIPSAIRIGDPLTTAAIRTHRKLDPFFYYQGGTDPRTFNGATFTRTGTALYFDQYGRYQTAASGEPRYAHYVSGSPTYYSEDASTNVCLQSETLGSAPWAGHNNAVLTSAAGTFAGRPFSSVTRNGGGGCWVGQTVTFTGDGVKAVTFALKQLGATGATEFDLVDTTASTNRLKIALTVNSDGSIVGNAVTGTLLQTLALGDGVYLFQCQTTSVTAANTNQIQGVNGGTLFNGTDGTGIYQGMVQCENNAFPTSYIPTTASTASRNGDLFTAPITWTPQALTVYCDATWELGVNGGTNFTAWDIGKTNAEYLLARVDGGALTANNTQTRTSAGGPVTSACAATAVFGNRIEMLSQLTGGGTVTAIASVNGGALSTGAPQGPFALDAAWSDLNVNIGHSGPSQPAFFALRRLAFYPGVHAMDEARLTR